MISFFFTIIIFYPILCAFILSVDSCLSHLLCISSRSFCASLFKVSAGSKTFIRFFLFSSLCGLAFFLDRCWVCFFLVVVVIVTVTGFDDDDEFRRGGDKREISSSAIRGGGCCSYGCAPPRKKLSVVFVSSTLDDDTFRYRCLRREYREDDDGVASSL